MTALEAHVAGCQVVVSTAAGIAGNLADAEGAWLVEPTVAGIGEGLDAARRSWTGWTESVDADVASPDRTADDVIQAAELALNRSRSTRPAACVRSGR